MRVENSAAILAGLKRERFEPLDYPDGWHRDTAWPQHLAHGLRHKVSLDGISTFENRPVRIDLLPQRDALPAIGCNGQRCELAPQHAIKGLHNIQLGQVKIIEHLLACMVALNLRLDVDLTEPSFPTFDDCNASIIRALELGNACAAEKPLRYFTVKKPVAMVFERGYVILEPDQGGRALTIDHQVSYPGSSIGNLRLVFDLTPQRFLWFCDARTTNFRPAQEAGKLFEMACAGALPGFPFTEKNILFCDEERFYNPRAKFDSGGRNLEFILHEVMDMVAFLKFVEAGQDGKFAGRVSTFYFDHHKQIDAMQWLCRSPELFTPIH